MSPVIAALRRHAAATPRKVALQDGREAISYGELPGLIERLSAQLRRSNPAVLAIHADNGTGWVLADLAAQLAGIPVVPLPLFFSRAQLAHIVQVAGIAMVLSDQPQWLSDAAGEPGTASVPFHADMRCVQLVPAAEPSPPLLPGTQKVSFTSGTTGEPRGVCLDLEGMGAVAESLRIASAGRPEDRHLCLLPLGTLLENIGGIYTPLLAGATVCVPPLERVGITGSSGLDPIRLVAALDEWHATCAIMVPQMLHALVAACESGVPAPRALRYLCVGGAPVSMRLLERAAMLGLPVHEGYGLSECASVVAVNRCGDNRAGSVGKPLPHVRLGFAPDGEILVRGVRWRGYVGEAAPAPQRDWISTGDFGYLDRDGFLHLTGRKKSSFITSFGRNVAPEWVERELVTQAPIAQAAVFGEARPFNSAVLAVQHSATPQAVEDALAEVNQRLPDYARVRAWLPASEPFSAGNGMLTPNGRLRRFNIFNTYAARIDALYQQLQEQTT
jgi:long-chain acyl-CoA synthetase